MAISGVNPKCYILALFVRDDGARFLLGDDPFEFKDNQLHFQQNTMANDVVEVQGNDGYLLAGQVRRPGTQMFDGYVCNGTNSKEEVEIKRRAFLQFFRRSHFYKVIYVFPNGTAIQRKQGFLVDDPTVQELYQQYPEYHVALNFEDVNYYTYEEDDQGHEIYAKEAIVPLARGGATGGLIWDSYGVVWEDPWSLPLSISGVQFQILNNAGARAPIDNVELYGDTYQQTYSGKNLLPSNTVGTTTAHNVTITVDKTGRITVNGTADANVYFDLNKVTLTAGSYMLSGVPFNGNSSSFRIAFNFGGTIQSLFSVNGKAFTLNSTYTATEAFLYIAKNYTANNLVFEPMIETGSSKTSYEPYVGGVPAPNPDYPQDIHTVTGEQTVNLSGKNRINPNNLSYAYSSNPSRITLSSLDTGINVTVSSGSTIQPFVLFRSIDLTDYAGSTIRMNSTFDAQGGDIRIGMMDADGGNRTGVITSTTSGQPISFTVPSNLGSSPYLFYGVRCASTSTQLVNNFTNLILTIDNDVIPFEPYQSQSYTVDLGSIELCKIGTYQDYIYKSGDDWYVHKEFGKYVFNGSEAIAYNSSNKGFTINTTNLPNYMPNHATPPMVGLSTHFSVNSTTSTWTADNRIGLSSAGTFWCKATSFATSQSDCLAWLTANTPSVYYALNTATDTKITDATLVGQLDALGAMKLFIGENNVLVGATNPNLPATLAFDYYSKFVTIGAEWEEGGTKGATIVNVDAIDNTYPVWELTGPATNPTLSVLTTNTALTYNGTITASQKLVIDMFNKTATLNGTSVIGNISGDFVYMAPGTNRLAYTAGNTDAPDSTIYWQEVVG